MLRVLIADDEELIRQLIKRLVDWDSLGLEIVAEAGDGFEAYDLMIEKAPDIAIVDIRMPGFDGLSLVRKARELNLSVYFMLVSGHKEFEYAHEALELGIQDYILKPIRREELVRNLCRARDSILSANEAHASNLRMRSVMEQTCARVRAQFMKDLIQYRTDTSQFELQGVNEEYGFRFAPGNFRMILCKQCGSSPGTEPRDWTQVSPLLSEALMPVCTDWESFSSGLLLYVLINYPETREDGIKPAMNEIFSRLPDALELREPQKITMAVGLPERRPSGLQVALRSAVNSLDSRFFYGIGRLICARQPMEPTPISTLIGKADEQHFTDAFDRNDVERMKTWLLAMLDRAFEQKQNPSMVIELSYYLVDLFYKNAKNMRRRPDANYDGTNIYANISCSDSREEIADILMTMVDDWYSTDADKGSAYIRFVRQYVEEHYGSDLRLTDIARAGNLSPTYLSRIFKEETGETFSDYLIGYRIQMAKVLLRNINMNVTEVAEQVGYCDVKHFSKSFKKLVGISPKDYRKLHAR